MQGRAGSKKVFLIFSTIFS